MGIKLVARCDNCEEESPMLKSVGGHPTATSFTVINVTQSRIQGLPTGELMFCSPKCIYDWARSYMSQAGSS